MEEAGWGTGEGEEGVGREYHGPPNDAHITPCKRGDPEAGIEAAAVEGKGGFRGGTGVGGRGGLEPVSSEKLLQTESNLSLALCAVPMVGKLVGRCARSLLELQGAVFAGVA